jgi:sulfur carrier protein
MKILVNGDPHEVSASNLASAMDELGFTGKVVATALNGEFVPATARTGTTLSEGDQLEVLAPMQGG